MEIKESSFLKWFQRPKHPSNNWIFTDEAISHIAMNPIENSEFHTNNTFPKEELTEIQESTIKSPAISTTFLDTYLQYVSKNEAQFPDRPEDRMILDTFDDVVSKMVDLLAVKSDVFKDCSVVKVGSTSEGLKSGTLNEFDYNLVLPRLSEVTEFSHCLQNESVNALIWHQFFADIKDKSYATTHEDEVIYFNIKDFSMLEGIIPQSELTKKLTEEEDDLKKQASALETIYLLSPEFSEEDVAAFREETLDDIFGPQGLVLSQQHSHFELIFKALDSTIEECLKESLPETQNSSKEITKGIQIIESNCSYIEFTLERQL